MCHRLDEHIGRTVEIHVSSRSGRSTVSWIRNIFNSAFVQFCSHNDPVQCMAFNPVSHQLLSCTQSDFAFWAVEQKAVQKFKVVSRINCCAWTIDGQYLALGLANGTVSIRNKAGEEKGKIERPGGSNAPIYAIAVNPISIGNTDVLCIADWNQTISFFTLGGQSVGKERSLGFDPLCASYFSDGEFITVAGCNKAVQFFTKDGIRLGMLGEQHDSWIWTTAVHPNGTSMVGVNDEKMQLSLAKNFFLSDHRLSAVRTAHWPHTIWPSTQCTLCIANDTHFVRICATLLFSIWCLGRRCESSAAIWSTKLPSIEIVWPFSCRSVWFCTN